MVDLGGLDDVLKRLPWPAETSTPVVYESHENVTPSNIVPGAIYIDIDAELGKLKESDTGTWVDGVNIGIYLSRYSRSLHTRRDGSATLLRQHIVERGLNVCHAEFDAPSIAKLFAEYFEQNLGIKIELDELAHRIGAAYRNETNGQCT